MPLATLSISGPQLKSCYGIVQAMKELGVCGDVTQNVSVDTEGGVEVGCRVLVLGRDAEKHARSLWTKLQTEYSLGCAHINVSEHRAGCTYDVFGPSRCPSCLQ
mgnify:CR=1 FL=1